MARVKKEMSDTPLENKTSKKTNLTAAEKKEYLQKIEQQNFAQNKLPSPIFNKNKKIFLKKIGNTKRPSIIVYFIL